MKIRGEGRDGERKREQRNTEACGKLRKEETGRREAGVKGRTKNGGGQAGGRGEKRIARKGYIPTRYTEIPVLPLPSCGLWAGYLPNLSLPQFLIWEMGIIRTYI